jgi:hypothetical protein
MFLIEVKYQVLGVRAYLINSETGMVEWSTVITSPEQAEAEARAEAKAKNYYIINL